MKAHCQPGFEKYRKSRVLPAVRRPAQSRQLIFVALFAALSILAFAYRPGHAQSGGTTVLRPQVYLPLMVGAEPLHQYDTIPIQGPPIDRPPAVNGDVNLSLRGYVDTGSQLGLIDISGPADVNAPQLAALFQPDRLPTFVVNHQVRDWDWDCGDQGCPADPITDPAVTLISMATTPGEALSMPSRAPDIYQGTYHALVIYATATQLTLVYTREDTPARGYVVHMEDLAVAPNLVTLYQEMDLAGRSRLPALRNDEPVGVAIGATVKVAIRDTGRFMDPRSRKDWWVGY